MTVLWYYCIAGSKESVGTIKKEFHYDDESNNS